MSALKHTPWCVEDFGAPDYLDGIQAQYSVRQASHEYGHIAAYAFEPEVARLIAAAPELLALARAFEAWEAKVILEGDWRDECVKLTPPLHEEWIQLAEQRSAAISKAEGRA